MASCISHSSARRAVVHPGRRRSFFSHSNGSPATDPEGQRGLPVEMLPSRTASVAMFLSPESEHNGNLFSFLCWNCSGLLAGMAQTVVLLPSCSARPGWAAIQSHSRESAVALALMKSARSPAVIVQSETPSWQRL
ncbi:hypothetical protein DPEC_G00068010 [Dallia pectoralis]|uniref:Uncharacterized protein n=1 Tax=Dallia pectoralis TaxID=75939 RepID=A0ACC2H1G7_DALPE|nr:hypothetical protein DPEC_G00068010 [Dallia pectoralis]